MAHQNCEGSVRPYAPGISDSHRFQAVNSGNEAYSAKLWAVYVSEAEKYDRALVETWRSNMDGMLIYVSYPRPPIRSLTVFCSRLGSSPPV
jgi:hypothetical protein